MNLKKIPFYFLIGLCVLLAPSFIRAEAISRVQYLMGTVCEIRVWDLPEDRANIAISKAFEEISRLEQLFSTYRSDSEVSGLNRNAVSTPTVCSPEVFDLIQRSKYYSEKTMGAFDITLSNKGSENLNLDTGHRTLRIAKSNLQMDFGGIGKGSALDKAVAALRREGVSQAEINFSGNLIFVGENDMTFSVDVADPLNPGKVLKRFHIRGGAVSTSSQWERKNHIVDPRTQSPAPFQGSVTVICDNATEADALSTALLVLGPEAGLVLMEKSFPDSSAAFFIPKRKGWKMRSTKNFPASFFATRGH